MPISPFKTLLLGLASTVFSSLSYAEPSEERFRPYGDNYLLLAQWTEHGKYSPNQGKSDDRAMEGVFGFEYVLFDCKTGADEVKSFKNGEKAIQKLNESLINQVKTTGSINKSAMDSLNITEKDIKDIDTFLRKKALGFMEDVLTCDENLKDEVLFSFAYNGKFDYYMATRHSGPVINRKSNTSLNFRNHDNSDTRNYFNYVNLAIWEHWSNGQVVEIEDLDENGNLKTQASFDAGDHEFFDSLSRGMDFASVTFGHMHDDSDFHWSAKLKIYNYGESSEINWGPLAGTDTSFEDYDLLRLNLKKTFTPNWKYLPEVTVKAEMVIGEELFETNSTNLDFIIPIRFNTKESSGWELPLLVHIHDGPMEDIADYAAHTQSIGIGLAFNY